MLVWTLACVQLPVDIDDLHGTWTHTDADGLVRTWQIAESMDDPAELAGQTDVYVMTHQAEAGDPEQVQWGLARWEFEHLVTVPMPSDGTQYSNLVVDFRDQRYFELEVDKETGDTRIYDWVDPR
jgi:hypothetical protein